jgi:hypothetical protein
MFTRTIFPLGPPGPNGKWDPPWITYPYEDLGLRLYAIGLFLVAATFYQSLAGEGRTSQKSKIAIKSFREIFLHDS